MQKKFKKPKKCGASKAFKNSEIKMGKKSNSDFVRTYHRQTKLKEKEENLKVSHFKTKTSLIHDSQLNERLLVEMKNWDLL